MTMILEKIDVAIRASRKSLGLNVLEVEGGLTLSNVSAQHAGQAWQDVQAESCEWLSISCFDEIGDQIEPNEAAEGERIKIHVRFESKAGAHYIFTAEGLNTLLRDDERLNKCSIVRASFCQAEDEFQTQGIKFERWQSEPQEEACGSGDKIVVARYVASLHPQCMPPSKLENWVLENKDNDARFRNGDMFRLWKPIAIDNLLKALVNEVGVKSEGDCIRLHGTPARTLVLGNICSCFDRLDELIDAVRWVYCQGEDIETRHTFLTAELARFSDEGRSFSEVAAEKITLALESARLMYKAHLRSSSKEIIKSLTDLRKNLTEDVQKIVAYTHMLTSSVWRSVALSIAVVGFRVFFYAARSEQIVGGFLLLYLFVAIYVFASYMMTCSVNDKFSSLLIESRGKWRRHLYGYLDDKDYNELAGSVLEEAYNKYLGIRYITSVIVAVLVGLVVLLLAYDLQQLVI